MRRWVETWLARLTERIRELIPQMGRCIYEWAICDFQWRDGWWARKGDNRWGAGTARGLNRDQTVKIARLTGCKNFVGKRKKFMFNAFVDLKPVERSENRSDMWGFRSLNNRASKRVLDLLVLMESLCAISYMFSIVTVCVYTVISEFLKYNEILIENHEFLYPTQGLFSASEKGVVLPFAIVK